MIFFSDLGLFNFMLQPHRDEFSSRMFDEASNLAKPHFGWTMKTSLSRLQHDEHESKNCSLSWYVGPLIPNKVLVKRR